MTHTTTRSTSNAIIVVQMPIVIIAPCISSIMNPSASVGRMARVAAVILTVDTFPVGDLGREGASGAEVAAGASASGAVVESGADIIRVVASGLPTLLGL